MLNAAFKIVDTPNNVTRYLPKMDGVDVVIRYITRGNPNGEKHVKLPEVRAIKAAGKQLGIVFETWGDFAHAGRGGISASDGAKDGAYARAIMPKLGAPAGACVYFAVDTDGTPAQLKNNVLPYFEAIREAFADGAYTVGIYGPGAFCQAVMDAGTADRFWLSNAKGWKGYKAFLPKADLVQGLPTHIAGGLDVDPNTAQVEDWGQFTPFAQEDTGTLAEAIPDQETDTPERLGRPKDTTDVVTDIATAAGAGGLVRQAKSLFRSKIAWLTGGLGGTGAAATATSDPKATDLTLQLLQRPSVWFGIAFIVIALLVIYFYWRDHGKGQP